MTYFGTFILQNLTFQICSHKLPSTYKCPNGKLSESGTHLCNYLFLHLSKPFVLNFSASLHDKACTKRPLSLVHVLIIACIDTLSFISKFYQNHSLALSFVYLYFSFVVPIELTSYMLGQENGHWDWNHYYKYSGSYKWCCRRLTLGGKKQVKNNGKKQWSARGTASLLFSCAFEVLVGELVKCAMCLRWGRFIRKTYKRVGETANGIFSFLRWCYGGTYRGQGIVAGNEARFGAPFPLRDI